MAARQERRAVGRVRPRCRPGEPAAGLPLPRQRPRRGHAGQAPRPRRRWSTTSSRRWRAPRRYGDIARLEQLLDEHANIAALDPAKLPAVRAQIWTLLQAARLDHDLGLSDRPDDERFDEFVMHVDGWLCEIKDSQIRDGLHVLGQAPDGPGRVDLVLAILRARQIWAGDAEPARAAGGAGARTSAASDRGDADRAEEQARAVVEHMEAEQLAPARRSGRPPPTRRPSTPRTSPGCWISPWQRSCRGWPRTTDEIDAVVTALRRRLRPGRPVRLAAARPGQRAADRPQLLLGRPQGDPVRLAWDTGQALADSLLARHRQDTGSWPESVGLSMWGTSAMRTPATTSPRRWRCWGSSPSGTTRHGG